MRTKCEGTLIALELLEKALSHKGLKLQKGPGEVYSEPIERYTINEELLAFLKTQGFTQQSRPDEVFTLIHEKFAGYWNFIKDKEGQGFDLSVNLLVGLGINREKGGIVFWPLAFGSFLSPDTASDKIHFHLIKALVESNSHASLIVKELAASDGSLLITWAELGLEGIKRLRELFDEFAGHNEAIRALSMDDKIFSPVPLPCGLPNEPWAIKEVQATIVATWREQLRAYRESLEI